MAETFRLTPEALEQRRRTDKVQTVVLLTALFIYLLYLFQREGYTTEKVLLSIIALLGLVGFIQFLITGQAAKNSPLYRWETYELVLDENSVSLKQPDSSWLILKQSQIRQIDDYGRSGLIINAEKGQKIHIPAGLTRYEEVKAQLASWGRLRKVPLASFYIISQFLLVVTGWIFAYLSEQLSPILALITGSLGFIAVASALFLYIKNPFAEKREIWDGCYIVLILVIVLATIIPIITSMIR